MFLLFFCLYDHFLGRVRGLVNYRAVPPKMVDGKTTQARPSIHDHTRAAEAEHQAHMDAEHVGFVHS